MLFPKCVFGFLSASLLLACQSSMTPVVSPNTSFSPIAAQSAPRANTSTQTFVNAVASAFHEAWRAPRRKADGTFEPRIKETKDPAWIAAHGTHQVDIANTPYAALPADWKAENLASAQIAVQLILDQKGQLITPAMIEAGSSVIHDKWLERNAWAKGGDLDKPYALLPEPEKQKDRNALYQAIHQGIQLKLLPANQVSPQVMQALGQMLK